MTLVEKLKMLVEKVLHDYEISEGEDLSKADSVVITAIQDMLVTPDISISEIQELLNDQVNRMSGKFFGFLPFVTDLRVELTKILALPQFSLARCLKEDNKQLKKMIKEIQHMKAAEVIGDKFVSKEQYDKDIKEMFQKMSDKQAAITAENELLQTEMTAIEKNNTRLIKQLEEERKRADNADAQINFLNLTLLHKNEEIVSLKKELDGFKQKLSTCMAEGSTTPLALTPREINSTSLTLFKKP